MSFMFLPQPLSGIIFDKTVKKKKNQNKTKQTNKQKQQQQKLLLNWLAKGNNGASSLIIDFFSSRKIRYSFIPTNIRKSCHESN